MSIALGLQKVFEVVHTGECGEGGSNSKQIVAVYHFQRTTFNNPITKVGIFNAWKTAIGDKVILAVNERYVSQNVMIRCMNDAEDPYSIHAFTDPGAVPTDSLPTHVCATLILRTATRGRYARGSKHIAPISESDIGDDILNGVGLPRIAAIATGLLNGFTDSNGNVWKTTILSKHYSTLTPNPTVLFAYDVTEVLVNKTLGIMHKRKTRTVR